MLTNTDFVEYLEKLAVEGETMLMVLQKPVTRAGEPVLNVDKTIKYTWLPHLPEALQRRRCLVWQHRLLHY